MAIMNRPFEKKPVIGRVSDFFPGILIGDSIPSVFIRDGSAKDILGLAVNRVIARSATVPKNFIGKVEDFNINFTTPGSGVVKVVILDPSGNIIDELIQGISTSQSGIGATVFPQQAIGLAIQTAGTGLISSIDFSGRMVFIGVNPP